MNPMLFFGLVATLITPSASTSQLTSQNPADNKRLSIIASDLKKLDMSGVKPPNETEWLAYKAEFGKSYSGEEDSIRRSLFAYTKHQVDKFNAEESKKIGYRQGINNFADLSESEMKMRLSVIAP